MSTIDFAVKNLKKNISEIQGLALSVINGPASIDVDIKKAYEYSIQQPTVVITDTNVVKTESVEDDQKIIVNLTGEDTVAASWAVKLVPAISEALCDPGLAEERDDLVNIVRQASFDLIQREMVNCSVYLTENTEFNCRIDLSVPSQFSKMAYDTMLHYYPVDEKNTKVYTKSKKTEMPMIRVICYPDWVNEEWLYWKSKSSAHSEEEPPRIMMIYDVETNTAFLLGAKSFSEVRKAVKIFGWNTAINSMDALPVNGTAKTVSITKGGKKQENTFLTISTSCSDRAFFGMNVHSNEFKTKNETISISGDSGLLMLTDIQGRKKSLINFGRNYFGSIDSASARVKGKFEPLSAENIAVSKDEKDEKVLLMNGLFSPVGRVHTVFNQEEKDLNLPEYVVMIVRDEMLPPAVLLKDPDLISATWFSLITECECCSECSIIPGGNPNAVWNLSKEFDVFEKAFKKTKFKMILLNSSCFRGKDGEKKDISDDILLSVYVKLAKGDMKWKEWKTLPGYFIPEKSSFKTVSKDFDNDFDVAKAAADESYISLARDVMQLKIDYLREACAPARLIAALQKIIIKLG